MSDLPTRHADVDEMEMPYQVADVSSTDAYFKAITTANTQQRINDNAAGKPAGPSAKILQFPRK